MPTHRPCAVCGHRGSLGMQRFRHESIALSGDADPVADLDGWRCASCGSIELDADSMRRYAEASDAQVLARRRQRQAELRRIRRKLGLTQREAARLTGGGHNAFSRYERGEAQPLPAVVNLFRLLDRHPELLAELRDRG